MQKKLLEKFLRYVSIPTQSDPASNTVPTTPQQYELAELLKEDLQKIGLKDLFLSDCSVLTGYLPANQPRASKIPKIGFCAHLDTVNVNLSPVVKPHLIKNYNGKDICLNREKDIWLRTKEYPKIKDYIGEDILVTDGTSVLGADNKAAIANIVTALEYLTEHPEIMHGDIYIAFVPDEECGLRGSKKMNFNRFPADFAYTIDCCETGEVVCQTFNAAEASVTIKGVPAHPMAAKGVMVNPTLIAVDLVNSFDRQQTPEHTEGMEGYTWFREIKTNAAEGTVTISIRDHHKDLFQLRKKQLSDAVKFLQARYKQAKIDLKINDIYCNIADVITPENQKAIDLLYHALKDLNIKAKTIAMRGGTDGSFISTKGILTPNYFTGAMNFHSNKEFLPLNAFEKSCRTTLKIIELTGKI